MADIYTLRAKLTISKQMPDYICDDMEIYIRSSLLGVIVEDDDGNEFEIEDVEDVMLDEID